MIWWRLNRAAGASNRSNHEARCDSYAQVRGENLVQWRRRYAVCCIRVRGREP